MDDFLQLAFAMAGLVVLAVVAIIAAKVTGPRGRRQRHKPRR